MMLDNIEKKFGDLTDYLRFAVRIVRKFLTPDAFDYPFFYPVYEKWPRMRTSTITYTDIRKGKFVFPDGIYPIVEIVQELNLAEYIRTGDNKNLDKKLDLKVILGTIKFGDEFQEITIIDDGTDKSFIKNWEEIFEKKIFFLRSDIILFLIVKNGILEIKDFWWSRNNETFKFGVDLLIEGNISPFGNTKIKQRYILSRLFSNLIIDFLWFNKDSIEEFLNSMGSEEALKMKEKIKEESDEYFMAKKLKNLVRGLFIENLGTEKISAKKGLWIDEMFKARRTFLYINSINLGENKKIFRVLKKMKFEEIRANPNKYPPKLPTDAKWIKYDDILYGREQLPSGVYIITQYYNNMKVVVENERKICNCLVLRGDEDISVVIYDIPEAILNYYSKIHTFHDDEHLAKKFHFYRMNIYHREVSNKKWKIEFIYSWPTVEYSNIPNYWADNYLSLFYVYAPFNPYIKHNNVLYIPDELVEPLLDAISKPEPHIQEWIIKEAIKDKEAIQKRLVDILYKISTGELSNYTYPLEMFDKVGEVERDKEERIKNWQKVWDKLKKEIQTSESKKEERGKKDKESTVIEVYSGISKSEHTIQPKQEEEIKEEQQKEVFEIKEEEKEQKFEELKPEEEPVIEEQKAIEKPKPVEVEEPKIEEHKAIEKPKPVEEQKIEKQVEEEQEAKIDKEQKETTEKPKRKKKEEKISEAQKVKETEEVKEQDIMEELEGADIEAKVKSKVRVKLPEDMLEELISEKPKRKKTTKRKKTKKSKKKKKKKKKKDN